MGEVSLTDAETTSAAYSWMRQSVRNSEIIFIGQSIQKLLMRSTQCGQTIDECKAFLASGSDPTCHSRRPITKPAGFPCT